MRIPYSMFRNRQHTNVVANGSNSTPADPSKKFSIELTVKLNKFQLQSPPGGTYGSLQPAINELPDIRRMKPKEKLPVR